MIDLYYWPTPNGFKVTIMLEELEVAYRVQPVDITAGAQHEPSFRDISPNGKIPAIVDHSPAPGFNTPASVFESGAILLYLAEKHQRLLPSDAEQRMACLQWLFWQMGGLGPMAGQAHHFRLYAPEQIEYAVARYSNECRRLYAVLEHHLASRAFIVDEYSIADIAVLPWIFRHERQGIDLSDFPRVLKWYERMMARPAVARGLSVAGELRNDSDFLGAEAQKHLFNNP